MWWWGFCVLGLSFWDDKPTLSLPEVTHQAQTRIGIFNWGWWSPLGGSLLSWFEHLLIISRGTKFHLSLQYTHVNLVICVCVCVCSSTVDQCEVPCLRAWPSHILFSLYLPTAVCEVQPGVSWHAGRNFYQKWDNSFTETRPWKGLVLRTSLPNWSARLGGTKNKKNEINGYVSIGNVSPNLWTAWCKMYKMEFHLYFSWWENFSHILIINILFITLQMRIFSKPLLGT